MQAPEMLFEAQRTLILGGTDAEFRCSSSYLLDVMTERVIAVENPRKALKPGNVACIGLFGSLGQKASFHVITHENIHSSQFHKQSAETRFMIHAFGRPPNL